MGRMLAQLWIDGAEFLSNLGDITPNPIEKLDSAQNARPAGFPAFTRNLLQSKVSYG
jgi:hypothetical protein